MSAADRWRVVVFSGCGHGVIAQTLAIHPRFEVVAVADDDDRPDQQHRRNESMARSLGVPYCRDVTAAVRQFRPQVACVSPEIERAADLSVRAATAGLHIIQDKPMASSVAECDRIVAAVERAGVRYALWNRNTFPAIEHTRRLLTAGAIGEPMAIHVDFYFAKDAGVLLDSDEPEEVPADWRGHGELTVEGIYPLAYIRHLLGVEARRVFARTTSHFFRKYADRGLEDLATVTLELERGIVGSLCIGRIGRASHANLGELKLHIMGSAGALVVSEPRPEVAVYTRGLQPSDYRQRRIGVYYERRLLDDFARAIDTGSETLLDARAGRAIVATVNAALESGRTGRVVRVPPGRRDLAA